MRTEKVTITIDEARELVSTAGNRPSSARWRIIVVEDADRMAERTTNVLLKAIEEPTPRTIWMLCAPSPADVLVTIRSRCRAVALRLPPAADVAALLVKRDGVDPAVAERAARAAQSHVGIARRLARDPDARERRLETVRFPLGLRGVTAAVMMAEKLVKIATEEANSSNDERDAAEKAALLATLGAPESGTLPPAMRSQVKQLEDDQKRRAKRSVTDSLDRTLTDLLSFYRDVLIIQMGNAVELVNVELRSELEEFAGQFQRRSDPCPDGRHQQGPQTDHHHQRGSAAGHRVHGRQPHLRSDAASDRLSPAASTVREQPSAPFRPPRRTA